MTKKQAVGQLNKIMKDNEIGGLLDLDGTFETNIKIFKENGLNVTKQRLQQFCNDYGIELLTDKQARNNKIFSLYKENQGKTLRELEQICKDNGININYSSLSRILRKIWVVAKVKSTFIFTFITICKHIEKMQQTLLSELGDPIRGI